MISIAILGYGTVGSGVAEVCRMNSDVIRQRVGRSIDIRYILDIRDFPDDPFADRITRDADQIINDPDVSVVVETIGGVSFAYEMTKRALAAGKHVVTSNKELVASHGTELIRMAVANGVSYRFEASVGGGIPIIMPLHKSLAANKITRVAGILNGTTNYILTRMENAGIDFATALKEAQANGYAEQEPAADIEGYDTCRKIAILASICRGEFIDSTRIYTEGITAVTSQDITYARLLGRKIKLLGIYQLIGELCHVMVAPMLVSGTDPVAVAEDVFNAIEVEGNALGTAMFYGRGAGRLPTASAVVADVIECAVHIERVPHQVSWEDNGRNLLLDHKDSKTEVLLRFRGKTDLEVIENNLKPYGYKQIESQFDNECAYLAGQNGNLTEGKLAEILSPLGKNLISRLRLYN